MEHKILRGFKYFSIFLVLLLMTNFPIKTNAQEKVTSHTEVSIKIFPASISKDPNIPNVEKPVKPKQPIEGSKLPSTGIDVDNQNQINGLIITILGIVLIIISRREGNEVL